MGIIIQRIETATAEMADFLLAHLDDLEDTAPPESRHALPFDRLLAPGVRLFAMTEDRRPIASGALAAVEAHHEEVKSMRTDPAYRGRGLGRAMLDHLLDDAAARGIQRISLETGSSDFFLPARALYAAAGFTECAAFGRYRPDPHSVFLTLHPVPVAVTASGAQAR